MKHGKPMYPDELRCSDAATTCIMETACPLPRHTHTHNMTSSANVYLPDEIQLRSNCKYRRTACTMFPDEDVCLFVVFLFGLSATNVVFILKEWSCPAHIFNLRFIRLMLLNAAIPSQGAHADSLLL